MIWWAEMRAGEKGTIIFFAWYGFSKTKAELGRRGSLGKPLRAHAFPSQLVSVYTIVLLRSFGPGGFAAEQLGVNDPFEARPGTGD